MPTVLREQGFRFHFYPNDHLPMHIHIAKGGASAKILLEPEIDVDKNNGFKPQEIKRIVDIITDHYEYLIKQWHETYGE